ncbi:hypothetical protein, partial [Acidiphilium sp.]|uniref:hypothetical protein n=1 Tax=Acidiphilium sp. TaxID=527 RepID=UPI002B5A7D84
MGRIAVAWAFCRPLPFSFAPDSAHHYLTALRSFAASIDQSRVAPNLATMADVSVQRCAARWHSRKATSLMRATGSKP